MVQKLFDLHLSIQLIEWNEFKFSPLFVKIQFWNPYRIYIRWNDHVRILTHFQRNEVCVKSIYYLSFPCSEGIPSGKTEIQMFKIIRDSHFRGNDNPVIITFYTVSMPLAKKMIIIRVFQQFGIKMNNSPLADKRMKLKRWFETQKEVEENTCPSEGYLSRFIGMKNIKELDSKNIDKILTCLPDRQAEWQLELSPLLGKSMKGVPLERDELHLKKNKIINRKIKL